MLSRLTVLLSIALLTLVACDGGSADSSKSEAMETKEEKFSIGLVTDTGGVGDGSFNEGTYTGIKNAAEDIGAQYTVVESQAQTDYLPNLSGLAEDGRELIFAVGFLMQDAALDAAKANPNANYAVIDVFYGDAPSNLLGITFQEEQAGYLAGIVAGFMTDKYSSASDLFNSDKTVGAVLGMDIPPVIKFVEGYKAGVASVCPDCKVLTTTVNSFTDQGKGKEAAVGMYNQGADIVFQVAGQVGFGVFNAAKEYGFAAIGVDLDQSAFAPDYILTSAIKRIDVASGKAVYDYENGTFEGGKSITLGLKDDGVGLAPFHKFSDIVPAEVTAVVEDAKADIISGKIVVPSGY